MPIQISIPYTIVDRTMGLDSPTKGGKSKSLYLHEMNMYKLVNGIIIKRNLQTSKLQLQSPSSNHDDLGW